MRFLLLLLLTFSAEAQAQGLPTFLIGYGIPAAGCVGPECEGEPVPPTSFQVATGAPTGFEEAMGMRAENREDAKGLNYALGNYQNSIATQGERVWIGNGAPADFNRRHPLIGAEPHGGSIRGIYMTTEPSVGVADLPPLGTAPANPLMMPHEGTIPVSGPGHDVVYFITNDGAASTPYYGVFTDDGEGNTSWDSLRVDGALWTSGAKNHSGAITESGNLVALHAHGIFPQTAVGSVDDPANLQFMNQSGTVSLNPYYVARGDSIYMVSPSQAPLTIIREVDGAYSWQRLVTSQAAFWGDEHDTSGGFGATPWYLGPPPNDMEGIMIMRRLGGVERLLYWEKVGEPLRLVAYEAAWYMIGGAAGDKTTYRIVKSNLQVQRLDALVPNGDGTATPTWVTEGTLTLPGGWSASDVLVAAMTEVGSIWLVGRRSATFPGGGTKLDIVAAYYRGGSD